MQKVWFITGAASGLGAGTAKAALENGDNVVATARNMDELHKLFSDVSSNRILFLQLDVTNEQQAKDAVNKAVEKFGQIDVLMNCAAYTVAGFFETYSNKQLEEQMATNFYGVVNTMRAVLPIMRKQRSGHIINCSSSSGVIGMKYYSAYCASKFALEGITLSVREEVEPLGIKVTVVEPGAFRTNTTNAKNIDFTGIDIEDYMHEESARKRISEIHGKQPGDPDKFGKAMVKVAYMDKPPVILVIGKDVLPWIKSEVEKRIEQIDSYPELSNSTEGEW